jgi:alcohol dehydrogenase
VQGAGEGEGMEAAVFDGTLGYRRGYPRPELKPGWAVIRVLLAGICQTDLEIMKGYLGFTGILGHEFVGVVDWCEDPAWVGKRVVGEINAACGNCLWCRAGLGRHCPGRVTLGISGLDGCMATFCTLPTANLQVVPDAIPDERAVLTEPLSAACEILEQLPIRGDERIVVLGDGRLGILCAWALATIAPDVTVVGHHPEKLERARWRGIRTVLGNARIEPEADIVVEATGSGQGIVAAISLCRPRGTIVLKSTVALPSEVNLSPVVIHELTVLGSRCGRFKDGMAMMQQHTDMPLVGLITGRYPLDKVEKAFAMAGEKNALKVLLEVAV